MGISIIIGRVVDALWAIGGIGAAAELGCEDFGPPPARPGGLPCAGVRDGRRTGKAHGRLARMPLLEGELRLDPAPRRSVR